MITSVAQIALLVRDYDEALEFYCEKLGFKLMEDTPIQDKRWVRVRAPGGAGADFILSRAEGDQDAYVGKQAGERVLFFLHTNAFEKDLELLRERGVELHEGPNHHPYGKVAVLSDLYGNRFDLIEPA